MHSALYLPKPSAQLLPPYLNPDGLVVLVELCFWENVLRRTCYLVCNLCGLWFLFNLRIERQYTWRGHECTMKKMKKLRAYWMFKGSFCLSIFRNDPAFVFQNEPSTARLSIHLSIFLFVHLSIWHYLALSPFYLSLCESLPISVSLVFFFLALALAIALSLSLPLPPGCLSLWSVYLSIYLLYNSARLPSKVLYPLKQIHNTARLPQKLQVHSSKMKKVCETSSKISKMQSWRHRQRSNSARLPELLMLATASSVHIVGSLTSTLPSIISHAVTCHVKICQAFLIPLGAVRGLEVICLVASHPAS